MQKGKQNSKMELPWIYKIIAFMYWLEGFKIWAISNVRLIINSTGTILSAIKLDLLTAFDDICRTAREKRLYYKIRALEIYEQMKEGNI